MYSTRFDEAFLLAHELHRLQTRKGPNPCPYVVHLLGVAALVGEYGGTEDQMIAALLHDAPEDQGGEATLGRIRNMFGGAVADIILACSDTLDAVKGPWRERKEHHIALVAAAPPEPRLVIAADKVQNMRSLGDMLNRHGGEIWRFFKGGREGSLWYHRRMAEALSTGWHHPILALLREELGRLHETAGREQAGRD